MSLRKIKNFTSKRKQNGKKLTKSQASKMKQKYEMDIILKEQISELEKEVLAIKIHESEGKLNRKMHLCLYMEEEISIYKTLYSGKLFLKSESMKLLNEAFEDFVSELFLLDQEYESMKSIFNYFTKRQHFCVEYQKRVDTLSALGAKLEESLLESEKCSDGFVSFMETFAALEIKASTEKVKCNGNKEEIWRKFDMCSLRIQNEANLKIDDVINGKNLKLDLLPLSQQALFCSGWLSKAWFNSSLKCLKFQQGKNSGFQKAREGLLQFQSDPDIISCQERQVLSERKTSEKGVKYSEVDLYLENQNVQEDKIRCMKCEMSDLEKALCSLEISDETYFEKSYLLQIVHKAGGILKQEFDI